MMKTNINIDSLNERTAGDRDLAFELLQMLKSDYINELNVLNQSVNQKDYKNIANILHRIKSSVGTLGFDNLMDEIEIVEKKALNFSPSDDLSIEINRIFISLKKHIVELEKILKT
ncbi:MAG: Hpt domain-containing protein [Bacteroidales bacterium]|nr:Hpt domain-containing protein [Bacteroidales bacterium]